MARTRAPFCLRGAVRAVLTLRRRALRRLRLERRGECERPKHGRGDNQRAKCVSHDLLRMSAVSPLIAHVWRGDANRGPERLPESLGAGWLTLSPMSLTADQAVAV